MKTRQDGIRVLRMLLNEKSEEYAREGVFASNPEMREMFTAAREVLDAPDPRTVREDIAAMLDRRAEANGRVTANPETKPLARGFAEVAASCAQAWAQVIRAGNEKLGGR